METRLRFNMGSLEAEMALLVRFHKQYALDDDITKLSMIFSIFPYYDVMLIQDTRTNESFSSQYQTKTNTFSNTTSYTDYHLNFSANNGDRSCRSRKSAFISNSENSEEQSRHSLRLLCFISNEEASEYWPTRLRFHSFQNAGHIDRQIAE